MTVLHPESNLISQSELSRILNIPAPVVARAIKQGLISPDEKVCGRLNLFDRTRLEEIRAALGTVVRNVPFINL